MGPEPPVDDTFMLGVIFAIAILLVVMSFSALVREKDDLSIAPDTTRADE
ncbi:hypothetical protein SAMN04490244_101250 [Tranquillimonas rosea]|uniref:Uncharacterized protein n=1 Tax=Tranquillimonas rosea TaxID=641238 RepID=A0A1H9PLY4_9RHOB|nr:hypothetical protein [Tranquillimonas rosea]SER49271.1 hypothetical protein SAMN04490244_101250 [Tranquillimonas rosea]